MLKIKLNNKNKLLHECMNEKEEKKNCTCMKREEKKSGQFYLINIAMIRILKNKKKYTCDVF